MRDGGLLVATPCRVVDLSDPESETAATAWWTELTESGGEGAVVSRCPSLPAALVACCSRRSSAAAGSICGSYYGPEYTLPEHLERLRERGLSGKRSLALREFALGIGGLERFVQR